MPTLVTGASGFIGAAVVRALIDEGDCVRALVRGHSNFENLLGLPIELVWGDIRDKHSVEEAVGGADRVIHLAADYRLWARDVVGMRATNVDGSANVLEAAAEAGARRIVHVSSVATIGFHPAGEPADERMEIKKRDVIGAYKRTKLEAESIAIDLARRGAPIVIVNPSTPIGPRDVRPTPTGRMILDAVSGRMPAYVNTGLNVVHVEDVARGILLAAKYGAIGQRYILGGENVSLKALLAMIAAASGRRAPRILLPRTPLYPLALAFEVAAQIVDTGEPMLTVEKLRMSKHRMYFTSEKAERELGYRGLDIERAVRDAVNYFQRGRAPS